MTTEERKIELNELIDFSDPKDLDAFTVHHSGVSQYNQNKSSSGINRLLL